MYNYLKKYDDKVYTGMRIGGQHKWHYDHGKWLEVKKTTDKWTIAFDSIKTRFHVAPNNSGAKIGTKYHWYIIADQIVTKLDANSYMTNMTGVKFKIGRKRPNWRQFSYKYPRQKSYKERVIEILEDTIKKLKEEL